MKFTLFLALVLVILVIFLFLRNLSATVIPSMALPMSIVGTFAVMYLLGYSLDNLSLMALTLSVGFVVDDAIVMLENIVRHMEMGERPMEAALRGSREIGFTIVSMTLSLAAVFIPVLFMSGILGRLLHEFAVTIGVAILVSGLVSLSLTPMLCSRFLRASKETEHGRLWRLFESFFDALLRLYDRTLQVTLRHSWRPWRFRWWWWSERHTCSWPFPKASCRTRTRGRSSSSPKGRRGFPSTTWCEHQTALEQSGDGAALRGLFHVHRRGGTMQGRIFVRLKPRNQRMSAQEIVQDLRGKLAAVPGINAFPQMLPTIRIGGQLTKSQYQFTLQAPDTNELYQDAPKLEAKLRSDPQLQQLLQDVTSDLQITNPQVNVDIDRDKASALGVTAKQVEDALYTAYGQRQISTIYAPNNAYRVITELQNQYQLDPSALSMLYVRSSTGQLVPLNAVARLTRSLGPLTINHLGQLPAVTISFNLRPGVSLGDAVNAVDKAAREMLPATVSTSFQGTAQAFESSLSGLGLAAADGHPGDLPRAGHSV